MPTPSPTLFRLFGTYCKWYIPKNFHSVRLSISGEPPTAENRPLIFYLNHASWWDPLISLLLARKFWPARQHHAPIDARALSQYPILSRIGFFGVEANTRRGAATFLRNSMAILDSPNSAIWITGEGRFSDPRTRPIQLRPGLAHLARRTRSALLIPLAIEYPFWEERFPEALCRFGNPIDASAAIDSTVAWNAHLAKQMQLNQDALAAESIARKTEQFRTILSGRAGVGAIYDTWRWSLAKLKGRTFHRRHGEQSS